MLGLDGGILGLAADFGDQVAGSLGFGGLLGRNGACSSGFGTTPRRYLSAVTNEGNTSRAS